MSALGFRSAACRRGHPWTAENTYTAGDGSRSCRRCASQLQAARRAARRPEPAPLALRPPGWTDAALCAQADPDAWYPEAGGRAADVKRVCARCPVRAECLEWALAGASIHNGIDTGVWGGTTPMERRALRRERRAA